MNTKDTSGPAFPLTNSHIELRGTDWEVANGLSVRDYFAAKAIPFIQWNSDNTALCAKRCYEIADAMLEARK